MASNIIFCNVEMNRWRNPDGSIGGLVAENAVVPQSTFVPFTSMIGPGAVISVGKVIPKDIIIDDLDIHYPNRVQPVSFRP